MTEWINYSVNPPEKDGIYLVCTQHDEEYQHVYTVHIRKLIGRDGLPWLCVNESPKTCGCNGITGVVTHWAYLPEPPIEINPIEYALKALQFRIQYSIWPPNSPCNESDYKEYIVSLIKKVNND